MGHSRLVFVLSSVVIAGGALVLLFRPQGSDLPVASVRAPQSAPAMCPWREPERDMALFFPGSSRYQTETVALSRQRQAIMQRLGPETPLESNALYVNRIFRGDNRVGAVLVRRASGQFGAIEVVVAVDDGGRIKGVRIQRHREPKETAESIASQRWLAAFSGKDADSSFTLGQGMPAVSESARPSAVAVTRAVRGLLIELAAGTSGAAGHIH